MTDRPMKTPRRRPPGFAERPPSVPDGVIARPPIEPTAPPPDDAAQRPTLEVAPRPGTKAKAKGAAAQVPRDPYAGAATRQVNMRLLEPLHSRYTQMVRQLDDDGYRTSLTEVTHALLDAGPTHPDEVRELVRRWRRRREP